MDKVPVISAKYVHSEDIPTFHERMYQLIGNTDKDKDKPSPSLVLVHYLDIHEALNFSNILFQKQHTERNMHLSNDTMQQSLLPSVNHSMTSARVITTKNDSNNKNMRCMNNVLSVPTINTCSEQGQSRRVISSQLSFSRNLHSQISQFNSITMNPFNTTNFNPYLYNGFQPQQEQKKKQEKQKCQDLQEQQAVKRQTTEEVVRNKKKPKF